MKKIIALVMSMVLLLSLFACGSSNEVDTQTVVAQVETTQEVTTETVTTVAPTTEAKTEAPVEEFDIMKALSTGYWVSANESYMYVHKFNGEEMWSDYYENHNGTYVRMDGPGYGNFCIPEIYEDSFMMYSTGGMTTTYYFTNNPRVIMSEERYDGSYEYWINYSEIPDYNTVMADMSKYR